MSKLKPFLATALISTILTGCSAIEHIQNARSAYQVTQAYSSAKGILGAEAIFDSASAYRFNADLMPHNEADAEEIRKTFERMVIAETGRSITALNKPVPYCEEDCPAGTVNIQFKEHGRDGFIQKLTMGGKIGGDLYVTQDGVIVEEYKLDMATDYAGMAQSVVAAIEARILRSAQNEIQQAHAAGELTDAQVEEKNNALIEVMNDPERFENAQFERLQGEA